MRAAMMALMVTLVWGCAPSSQPGTPDEGVRLSVGPGTVAPGEAVTLVLTNGLAEPVGYNLCTSELERRAGSEWEPVPSDRACTMELRTLEPGADASYAYDLPPELSAGEYRFSASVERMEAGGRERVSSGAFQVGG